jgi:hypothetical protein
MTWHPEDWSAPVLALSAIIAVILSTMAKRFGRRSALPQGLLKHLKEHMRHLCSRKLRHVVNDEEGNSF